MQISLLHLVPTDSRVIAERVKAVIGSLDASAMVILFGSRARGDASAESDWDFLVLTDHENVEALAMDLRRQIRIKVEMVFDIAVSLIVKNKKVWEEDYAVTNIYDSIQEEGIML